MQARLTWWLGAAAVFVFALALFTVGFSWLLVLAVGHVPAVLAALLAARAAVLLATGRSAGLSLAGRTVLDGLPGLLVPLAFLLAWTWARETGLLDMHLARTASQHSTTTNWTQWQENPAAVAEHQGLAVDAPAGALGDAFRAALVPSQSLADGSRLHGRLHVDVTPPFAWLPLWKSAQVNCRMQADLILQPQDAGKPARTSTITMDVEAEWEMIGLASRRSFHTRVGRALGEMAKKAMDKHLRTAAKG